MTDRHNVEMTDPVETSDSDEETAQRRAFAGYDDWLEAMNAVTGGILPGQPDPWTRLEEAQQPGTPGRRKRSGRKPKLNTPQIRAITAEVLAEQRELEGVPLANEVIRRAKHLQIAGWDKLTRQDGRLLPRCYPAGARPTRNTDTK